jgi:hypothetical protein
MARGRWVGRRGARAYLVVRQGSERGAARFHAWVEPVQRRKEVSFSFSMEISKYIGVK